MYVSGIHTGIQAGHAITEMFSYYLDLGGAANQRAKNSLEMLKEFARNHKTFVILNGGDHAALQEMLNLLNNDGNPGYPRCLFQEPGLNNAITSVCVVLPERMYDDVANKVGKAMLKAEIPGDVNTGNWTAFMDNGAFSVALERHYTEWEREFLKRKAMCNLAN